MSADPCCSCGGSIRTPARYSRQAYTVSRTTDRRRRAKRRAARSARRAAR